MSTKDTYIDLTKLETNLNKQDYYEKYLLKQPPITFYSFKTSENGQTREILGKYHHYMIGRFEKVKELCSYNS